MKTQRILISVLLLFLIVFVPFTSFAHSGRTDSSGGHRDNCNQSGLGYYHYHCNGFPAHLHTNGECPYKRPETIKYEDTTVLSEKKSNAYKTVSKTDTKTKPDKNVRNLFPVLSGIGILSLAGIFYLFNNKKK